jgi:hypothetical protein
MEKSCFKLRSIIHVSIVLLVCDKDNQLKLVGPLIRFIDKSGWNYNFRRERIKLKIINC